MPVDLLQPSAARSGNGSSHPRTPAIPPLHKDWGGWMWNGSEPLSAADPRHVTGGSTIPALAYADQPYLVSTPDGGWLCVLTTGAGEEGQGGQHILALRSEDHGRTWSAPAALEPPEGPEASWAVALAAPSGRIFAFYVYNADNIRELPCGDGVTTRMDSHGQYVFRWSDDGGRSWSARRVTIPVREFEIDRTNSTGGAVRLFWNVGRPIIVDGSVFLPMHKVGGFGDGWFTRSEGAFVRSEDLLTAEDPADAVWVTLPEGETGLRTPPGGGPVAEEQCLLELSDGSLFSVYRSIDGYPAGAYSRDKGRTWETPAYLRHANGRLVKHPRAACFAWRLRSGGHVLWFHNHGGAMLGRQPNHATNSYLDRNPVWMCPGREIETPRGIEIVWENPEIVLYDDDPLTRMSYPDLIEEEGRIFLTETQKTVARVHEVSPALAHALRHGAGGVDASSLAREALLEWTAGDPPKLLPSLPPLVGRQAHSPHLSSDLRSGFSIEVVFRDRPPGRDTRLLQAWHPSFGGFRLEWSEDRRFRFVCSDGRTTFEWGSDALAPGHPVPIHLVITVDGGPKVISFIVNGGFHDGGDERQFGWGRFNPNFRGIPVGLPLDAADGDGISSLRIYPRALLAAESAALDRLHRGHPPRY